MNIKKNFRLMLLIIPTSIHAAAHQVVPLPTAYPHDKKIAGSLRQLRYMPPVFKPLPTEARSMCNIFLESAIDNDDESAAKRALALGADPNHKVDGTLPVLHEACLRKISIMKLLLRARANPNVPDENGMIPLHYACAIGAESMARTLLIYGSDVNKPMANLKTPFSLSLDHAHVPIQEMLLQVGIDDMAYGNAFIKAFKTHDILLAQRLLDSGFDINKKLRERGLTLLHCGIMYANPAMLDLLVARNANVNARATAGNVQGLTPYMAALLWPNLYAIDLLLKARANPYLMPLSTEVENSTRRDIDRMRNRHIKASPAMLKIFVCHGMINKADLEECEVPKILQLHPRSKLTQFVLEHDHEKLAQAVESRKITVRKIMKLDSLGMSPWLWAFAAGNRRAAQQFMAISKSESMPIKAEDSSGKRRMNFNPLMQNNEGENVFDVGKQHSEMIKDLYDYNVGKRVGVLSLIRRKKIYFPYTLGLRIGEFLHGQRMAAPAAGLLELPGTNQWVT